VCIAGPGQRFLLPRRGRAVAGRGREGTGRGRQGAGRGVDQGSSRTRFLCPLFSYLVFLSRAALSRATLVSRSCVSHILVSLSSPSLPLLILDPSRAMESFVSAAVLVMLCLLVFQGVWSAWAANDAPLAHRRSTACSLSCD
jgi:hypothetical protein